MKRKDLPDEEVVIKISCCNDCNGVIRAAVKHMMITKSRNDFMKEVMQHNLSVKEIPLLEYRKNKLEWCKCRNL